MNTLFKLIILASLLLTSQSHAVLDIKITQGIERALPIAIVPFGWSQASHVAPIDLTAIISDNLARSGRFNVMNEQALPQRPNDYNAIRFADWRKIGMEHILIGKLNLTNEGDYEVVFRLVDIYRKKQIAGFRIPATLGVLRRNAHQISDIIFEKLTGIPGAFDTRVAYITANKKKKMHSLHIADADGHNAQILLESPEPILSPSWAPDGKRMAYVSFEGKNSAIYVQHIATGQRHLVSALEGINSSPDWSPDGRKLAITLSKDGNTEIYVLDLNDISLTRITDYDGIDTEPSWSPDGKKLAFTSDRSGGPQIYEIDLSVNNSQPKRISFEGKYNARAEYSPDGKFMTLVHAVGNSYRIGLLDLETGNINVLTDSKLAESPSFAPNGNMIIYANTGSHGGQLATVSIDGHIHQRLGLQKGDVREPAWGPFLE